MKRFLKISSLSLIIFSCVLCIAICNDIEVLAKTYNLRIGEVTSVEIKADEDEFQFIRIPFGYCDFRIEITDIQVWVGGEVHNEYVQYVYADDVYDTGKEYYASNGVISFKKDGRESDYERAFLLEMDDIELYPEVDITEEYIIKCNIRISKVSEAKLSKTNITCYLDDIHGKTVKLNNASDKIVWTISNKKVASVYREDNSVTVYPKNPGTCYLKAKCGGQSFRCKVKVKGRKYVYAGGYIYSYNTCGDGSIDVKGWEIEVQKSVVNKGFPGVGNCRRVVPTPGFFAFSSSMETGLRQKIAWGWVDRLDIG